VRVNASAREPSDSVILNRSQAIVLLLSGLALLALNIVQFVYVLNPRLRPDPAERLRAEVRALSVEPRVTRIEHLERITAPALLETAMERDVRRSLEPPRQDRRKICAEMPRLLSSSGWIVYARVTAEGLKRRRVELSAALYNGATNERFEEVGGSGLKISPRRLDSPSDTFVETIFVPLPPRQDQPLYVQLELRTETGDAGEPGTLLDTAHTKPFRYYEPNRIPNPLLPRCPP
jgi:hypothetical protein